MESDPLYPIVQLGEFWDRPSKDFFSKRIQFFEQVFMDGLDYRINLLLKWVDECIDLYSEDSVLI